MTTSIKSREVSNPKRIQGTNDNSILSKCSMIKFSYFNDEFLTLMTSKSCRRAPLINRGYYVRAKAIDHILNRFVENFGNSTFQIISLGAGFDTSFFRFHNKGLLSQCTFVEVDYHSVAMRKAVLMKQETKLWECLKNHESIIISQDPYIVINADNYKLIGTDMTQLDVLDACFNQSGVSNDLPTLFISECVITYIGVKKTKKLLNFFSKYFPQNSFLLYEQVYPDDNFGRFMCQHFKSLGSSLRGISTYKTKQSQVDRFLNAGWEDVFICDMARFFYHILPESERIRVEDLEVFDEYEEWILKCGHYFVLVANKGLSWNPEIGCSVEKYSGSPLPFTKLCLTQSDHENLSTYPAGGIKCHYSKVALLTDADDDTVEFVARISGYGQNPYSSGHSKLASISVFDPRSRTVRHIPSNNSDLLLNSIGGSVTRSGRNEFILFGGRCSPLNPNNSLLKMTLVLPSADEPEKWECLCEEILNNGNDDSTTAVDGDANIGPSPRWRHSTALYYVKGKSYLLIHGGRDSNSCAIALSDTWILDVEAGSVRKQSFTFPAIGPGPLYSGYAVSLCNPLVQSGGGSGNGGCKNNEEEDGACCGCCDVLLIGGAYGGIQLPSNKIWRWCGRSCTWTEILIPSHFGNCAGRISHTVHVVSGLDNCCSSLPRKQPIKLLIVGGVGYEDDVGYIGDHVHLMTIDLVTNTVIDVVRMYIDNDDKSGSYEMLYNHGSDWSDKSGRLWLIGGGGNCFSFGTQLNSDVYFIDFNSVLDADANN